MQTDIITNEDTAKDKYFWQNKWLRYFALIVFLSFAVFYFAALGHYTNEKAGETIIAMRFSWFEYLTDSLLLILFLTPFVYLYIRKFQNKKVKISELRIFALGYFTILAFTLAIFTLQTITSITLSNPYYSVKIDFKLNLYNANDPINYINVNFANRNRTDIIYASVWLFSIISLYITTIVILMKFKDNKNKKIFYIFRDIRNTSTKLASFALFSLMVAAFGLGVFGIRVDNINDFIKSFTYNGGENTNPLALWNQAPLAFKRGAIREWNKLVSDLGFPGLSFLMFLSIVSQTSNSQFDKGQFWGVNNNWPGYLIFALMVSLAIYILVDFIKNTILILKDKKEYDLDKKDYTFESFVGFMAIILTYYFIDRYVIVNVANGSWNPNLFNNGMVTLAMADYTGTAYYWFVFISMQVFSLSVLFYLNRPFRQKLINIVKRNNSNLEQTN